MRGRGITTGFGILSLSAHQSGLAADALCEPLRSFVASVKPNETRVIRFNTNWGSNFSDDLEPAMAAKRCDHNGYEPAKAVCAYFMEHGAIEFSGNNVKTAVACHSPKTRFAPRVLLNRLAISFSYGTDERGGNVEIIFDEDLELGGMRLVISVDGY